jgi:hypothetical protein
MTERLLLYYNKYDPSIPNTEISKEDFYTNLKTVSKTSLSKICVYLTNGANERVGYQFGDKGTTLGFNSIKNQTKTVDLFDTKNFTVIFDSNTFVTTLAHGEELRKIINDKDQVANTQVGVTGTKTKISAGSVIKVKTPPTDAFPVCGGYHIKGIQWNIISDKSKEKESVPLVKEYYSKILNDFIKYATDSKFFYILHLAQIPGGIFGGTQITGNAMHDAVQSWLLAHPADKKNFMISIDFNKPTSTSPSSPPGSTPSSPPGSTPSSLPSSTSSSTASSPSDIDITKLQTLLQDEINAVDASKKNHTMFKLIDDIYKNFFSESGTRTSDSLIQSINSLLSDLIGVDKKYGNALIMIKDSLNKTPPLPVPSEMVPGAEEKAAAEKAAADDKKKYVFAFDVDNTLVSHGSLYTGTSFVATHAADHAGMLALMKAIIGAGHYVWIVTASDQITKATFEKFYLKGDTDTEITNSGNYYFMNPSTVEIDLNGTFIADTLSPLLTNSVTPEQLTYTSDTDFQTKGLKPYAMLAKWIRDGFKVDNVKMYLFDDNDVYKKTCDNCNGEKVEFVKITPRDSAAGVVVTDNFDTDVLEKATNKFKAISTTATATATETGPDSSSPLAASSGGGKLKVMTFNTWYEAFSPNGDTAYCFDGKENKCTDTIMKTIVDRMKEGGPQVIFLQEFTSRGDEFFEKAGVTIKLPEVIKSESYAKGTPPIPQFRHFTMTTNSKTFYVYTATIGQETITTIYSSELNDGSADKFFIGNTAAVKNDTHDNSPYFWKDNTNKADETDIWIFGGARPYIVLEFKNRKLVLINLHSHHSDEKFRPPIGKKFDTGREKFVNRFKQPNGTPNSVQTYGFSVLGNMLRDKSRILNLDDCNIVVGGDFNAPPDITLKLLNLSLGISKPFTNNGIDRANLGNTCCTTTDAKTFREVVDQIYSRGLQIVKDSYKVYNKLLEKGKGKTNQNYFSDHLPVYAEIVLLPST